uniref:Protein TsetseEP domain-containing protein n=1 Tax=Anopheles culicifacies TaxID=139723 RepID=A0A182M6S6_9DIPT
MASKAATVLVYALRMAVEMDVGEPASATAASMADFSVPISTCSVFRAVSIRPKLSVSRSGTLLPMSAVRLALVVGSKFAIRPTASWMLVKAASNSAVGSAEELWARVDRAFAMAVPSCETVVPVSFTIRTISGKPYAVCDIVAATRFEPANYTAAEPRPEFTVGVSVPGTNRVGLAANQAQTIISNVKSSSESFTIRAELPLLASVLTVVQNVANQFQPLGTALITSITTLASDTSGNVDTVYDAAITAVDNTVTFADVTLPGLTNPLIPLIGRALLEKFEDSLKHIGKALTALKAVLIELKTGTKNAVTEAGSTTDISATIINRTLPRATITKLVNALHMLRANVPILKYTIDSTIEGLGIADQYMLDLSAKVDSTIGEKSSIAADLDGIIGSIDRTITDTMTTVGTDLANLKTDYATLTNLATAASASKLTAVLGAFEANLVELSSKDPTILAQLNSLKESLLDVYDVAAPLYFIFDSTLVNTLIATLVANGNYSQYCFYKYKDYLFAMLAAVTMEARECVDKEVQRLEYFRKTIEIMLNLLFFDFEDISGDLTVCNEISDATSLEECVASLETIYTRLEAAFGDMFALGYDIISHEVKATSNRLKICMRLSQSELGDTEIPMLITKITDCAALGPTAEND